MSSQDGGKTWTGPVRVNDVDDAAREGLHAMAAGLKGEMCCVWLDLRNKATEVMSSTSLDGGKTWSKNVLAYKSPDGSVCECCHPSVAIDERGRIYVQWRNSLGGNRDIYGTVSTDSGKTFGNATKLGTGTWTLKACPMDGGAFAVSGDQVSSVWRREKSLFLVRLGNAVEQPLGMGEQPWIAATKGGPFVVASQAWHAWALFLGYALFYGLTEPAEKTLIAQMVPIDRKGLAFGWFNFTIGIATLPASLVFGAIYQYAGPLAAFSWGASLAAVAMALMLRVRAPD